jgi:ATP-dependent helicase HrpB
MNRRVDAGQAIAAAARAIDQSELPITEVLAGLCRQLASRDDVVLQAPPGAGKTTLVPLAMLMQPWLKEQKILMLEPRRLAARAAAERMAQLLGEQVGATVGYRMRLDTRVGPATRIEVITEGILTRMLQSDPALAGVGLVIFDEFHERNLDSDLGLALALQGRALYRDQGDGFKLLVMSATLDGAAVAKLLGDAPLVISAGRMFPVTVHYGETVRVGQSIVEPAMAALWPLLCRPSADSILVFLPGQGEIQGLASALSKRLTTLPEAQRQAIVVAPLYGGLSLEQQQLAIEPAATGCRKLVLATNIAETSLTIEGITTVVDCGLVREPAFDAATGMTRLQTRRIAKASSIQRMGRAGRLGPGRCFRLWSEAQQQALAAHGSPEILQADLAPLVLQLLYWGVDDVAELDWLDPPPRGPFEQGLELLGEFGATEKTAGGRWQLSRHGERMATLPVHPRLAHLLLVGVDHGLQSLACHLAALLSERDPLGQYGADLWHRWSVVNGESTCPPSQRGWRQRIRQQAKRFARLCVAAGKQQHSRGLHEDLHEGLGMLVASAYPDRIARRRGGNSGAYQLSNGRSALLGQGDALVNSQWLAVAELGGRIGVAEDRIYSAAALAPRLFDSVLADQVQQRQQVLWDDQAERMVAQNRLQVGALLLATRSLGTLAPESKRQALLAMLHRRGLDVLPWNPALRQWQARVMLLRECAPGDDNPWPDVSDAALLATAGQWLLPWLDGVDSLAKLQKLDLASVLHKLLPWPLPRQLEVLAPPRIVVPSGSSIEIDYCHQPPVLAVKLQEMFGCEQTPSIVNGRVALLLHLLSPARRPLQVTQDLAGFWRGSYQDVKKDMKGRYPKHPWPDDPLVAPPTRHVKKRRR